MTDPTDEPTPQTPDEPTEEEDDEFAAKKKKTTPLLIAIILGSFAFAIASIPLYRLVCHSVDPGGSSAENGTKIDYGNVKVDKSRTIRLRFAANVEKQLPWDFEPPKPGYVNVHPGEKKQVFFYAKNLDTTGQITGKAVYDINPPDAAPYFKKFQCFCFTEQTLEAGEEKKMPVVFWFDPDVPKSVTDVTLAYTFFNSDSTLGQSMKVRAQR